MLACRRVCWVANRWADRADEPELTLNSRLKAEFVPPRLAGDSCNGLGQDRHGAGGLIAWPSGALTGPRCDRPGATLCRNSRPPATRGPVHSFPFALLTSMALACGDPTAPTGGAAPAGDSAGRPATVSPTASLPITWPCSALSMNNAKPNGCLRPQGQVLVMRMSSTRIPRPVLPTLSLVWKVKRNTMSAPT